MTTIRKIGVLSAGKIMGCIYGAIGLVAGLFMSLFGMLGLFAGLASEEGAAMIPGALMGVMGIFVGPIFYGAMGFIGGVLTALIYNVASGFIGGIEVELDHG